jgi:Septum formation
VRGWIIRIAIIAAIAIGAFVLRDRLSSNAGDLAVGDCFDEPAEATEVKDVQHHPCTEPHTSEVVFVGDIGGGNDAYPTETQFLDFVRDQCVPAFNTYTGLDFDTDTTLDMGYFYPLEEGWKSGDQEMICYVIRLDKTPTSQSIKAP